MNALRPFPGSPLVALATGDEPYSSDRPECRSRSGRLRDGAWISLGVLLGVLFCVAVVTTLPATVTVHPLGLGSLAVFAMLVGSVRESPGTPPLPARLASAALPRPWIRLSLRHAG